MRGAYATLGLGTLPAALVSALEALPPYHQQPYDTPPALEQQIRAAWAIGFQEQARG